MVLGDDHKASEYEKKRRRMDHAHRRGDGMR